MNEIILSPHSLLLCVTKRFLRLYSNYRHLCKGVGNCYDLKFLIAMKKSVRILRLMEHLSDFKTELNARILVIYAFGNSIKGIIKLLL